MNKLIRTAIATAAIAVGSIAATSATPAHAASAVSACFKYSDTGTAYMNQPISLVRWTGSTWASTGRSGRTNANGCATFFSTNTAQTLSIRAHVVFGDVNIGQAIYSSRMEKWATPGTGGVSLGSNWVYGPTCTQGLYRYCAGLR